MAHLHFRRTVYKGGGSEASGRIEYITSQREHDFGDAERQLAYIARENREDLVFQATRNLPGWAGGNPHSYFQAAERYEAKHKVSWTAFEEWKFTLPHELSLEQNLVLVEEMIDAVAGDRLPCTYAFHDPTTMDETQRQPHIHLLISARMTDEHTRTPAQHFKISDKHHPERGGARKDPALWHWGAVKANRLLISDVMNVHLERHGMVQRVHPDTLESRGIAREAEPKLRPSESQKYREKGVVSKAMEKVLDIRQQRAAQWAMEVQGTRQYWDARKEALGIEPDDTHTERLAKVRTWRTHTVTNVTHRSPERPQTQRRDVPALAHEKAPMRHAGKQPTWTTLQGLAASLAHEDTAGGGTLRVRLHDTTDHEKGLTW